VRCCRWQPDAAYDLDAASAALEAAVPDGSAKQKSAGNGGNGADYSYYQEAPAEWRQLIRQILTGEGYHDATVRLAAKLVAAGVDDAAAVNLIRALMEETGADKDARWRARFDDVVRCVRSAREKYGAHATETPSSGPSFYAEMKGGIEMVDWLIKGVFAKDQISSVFGPPGSGKSSLATDIGFHIPAALPWRGHRVKKSASVVHFALERGRLIMRRLAAYKARTGLNDLPIAVQSGIIDLLNPSCVQHILDTMKVCEDRFGTNVGLITIDTWSKGIAVGGGKENEANDQNRALGNLRTVIDRHPGTHILTVGHTGKDESRGERGSNAKEGDVDLAIQISDADGIKLAEVTKANNRPPGLLTRFEMVPHVFGYDEDGDPCEVWYVSAEIPAEPSSAVKDGKRQKLSERQILALRALTDAVLDHGRDLPREWGMPRMLKMVTLDQWQERMVRDGLIPAGRHATTRLQELREALQVRNCVGVREGNIWDARRPYS
jgi:hypothetical protein